MEFVVRDSVPVVAHVLGIPESLAELAVRHVVDCFEPECPVTGYLNEKILAHAAQQTGIPAERLEAMAEAVTKSANDTVRLRSLARDGRPLSEDELREIYLEGRGAMATGMEVLSDQAE